MKVLITGGTGFQGSNLAKSLLDDGHQVRLLNLYSEKSKTNVEIFKLKEAEVVWGTINDIHTVEECVRDVDIIVHCAEWSRMLVTVEDHTVVGGLGSAVSDVLSEHIPTDLYKIGLNDIFPESAPPKDLYEKYGLSAEQIAKKVLSESMDK